MRTAEDYIDALGLEPHIEGGYFKELYQNGHHVGLDRGERPLSSTIYYLLKSGQISRFHRLASDELWFYHDGNPLMVYTIDDAGALTGRKLGLHTDSDESPQLRVPANVVFGAEVIGENSFTLVSCMVSPGFDYRDFRVFGAEELIRMFPKHYAIIKRLNG